ncbi:MAG: acyl-CoA dehydrogenase family protein, partial [Rhodanobacter sp.]
MSVILTVLAAILATGVCAYQRTRLSTWAIVVGLTTLIVGLVLHAPWTTIILLIIEALIAVPLLMVTFRRNTISAPLLKLFAKVTPKLSETEQTALEAGTVGFEGELFSGKPDWRQLLRQPKPELSVEEQAFMDGPVEQLCSMIDDWQITHELADLPPELWAFIKQNKFFGMIIPKHYNGLGFSALAHSAVLQKLATMSA